MGGLHGTYLFAKVFFFPLPMIIAGINNQITDLAFLLSHYSNTYLRFSYFIFYKVKLEINL